MTIEQFLLWFLIGFVIGVLLELSPRPHRPPSCAAPTFFFAQNHYKKD